MQTPDERRKAKVKRKRAAREAAYKQRVADAKARQERRAMALNVWEDSFFGKGVDFEHIPQMPETAVPRPEDRRWNWDSRVKPPEG